MFGKIVRASILACVVTAPASTIATARSAYDGAWGLSIVTDRGACDRNYYFGVQIVNGHVRYQGPARFSGHVGAGGAVRVSVTAGDKRASGSGRLSRSSGSGRWVGSSGGSRCSGHWTAQRS